MRACCKKKPLLEGRRRVHDGNRVVVGGCQRGSCYVNFSDVASFQPIAAFARSELTFKSPHRNGS